MSSLSILHKNPVHKRVYLKIEHIKIEFLILIFVCASNVYANFSFEEACKKLDGSIIDSSLSKRKCRFISHGKNTKISESQLKKGLSGFYKICREYDGLVVQEDIPSCSFNSNSVSFDFIQYLKKEALNVNQVKLYKKWKRLCESSTKCSYLHFLEFYTDFKNNPKFQSKKEKGLVSHLLKNLKKMNDGSEKKLSCETNESLQETLKEDLANDLVTCPIELVKSNPKLKDSKIEQAKQTFLDASQSCSYNNVAPILEVMAHFRHLREENPTISVSEAYEDLLIDPSSIYDKYRSGECIVLSSKIQQNLKQIGVDSSVVGRKLHGPWTEAPLEKAEGVVRQPQWNEYFSEIGDQSHCSVIVRFSNRNNKDGAIHLDPDFSTHEISEEKDYAKLAKPFKKGEVKNPGALLKRHMRGKYRAIMAGHSEASQLAGVDFMNDNFFMNSSAIDGISGLPLIQRQGKSIVSFHFSQLMDPDGRGQYLVDGKSMEMNHREALRLALQRTSERFYFPDDFYDNLIVLAENHSEFIHSVLLKSIPAIKSNKELEKQSASAFSEIAKKMISLSNLWNRNRRNVSDSATAEELANSFKEIKAKYASFRGDLIAAQTSLLEAPEKDVKRLFNSIVDEKDSFLEQMEAFMKKLEASSQGLAKG